jgi:hypothetical protein
VRNGQVSYNDEHRKPGFERRTAATRSWRARHPKERYAATQRYHAKYPPGDRSRKHYTIEEDFVILFDEVYPDPFLSRLLERSVTEIQAHRSKLVERPLPLIEWYGLDKEEVS